MASAAVSGNQRGGGEIRGMAAAAAYAPARRKTRKHQYRAGDLSVLLVMIIWRGARSIGISNQRGMIAASGDNSMQLSVSLVTKISKRHHSVAKK